MKHLRKFNENNTEKLEAQDLLDFSQDLVDLYTVKYYVTHKLITDNDIIDNNDECKKFQNYLDGNGVFKIEVSEFPMSDFQKILNYMEAFKRHVDQYSFVLDDFKVTTNVSEDMDRNPIITTLLFYFVKVDHLEN